MMGAAETKGRMVTIRVAKVEQPERRTVTIRSQAVDVERRTVTVPRQAVDVNTGTVKIKLPNVKPYPIQTGRAPGGEFVYPLESLMDADLKEGE